jgi:hypothetical protein
VASRRNRDILGEVGDLAQQHPVAREPEDGPTV